MIVPWAANSPSRHAMRPVMNALFKSAGVLVAATVAVVAAALPATAATGSPLSANNACPNPALAQNAPRAGR